MCGETKRVPPRKMPAGWWMMLALVAAMTVLIACTGCMRQHETETAWIKQSTQYATSIVEYLDGDQSEDGTGLDLAAALAADFSAEQIDLIRTDGTTTLTIKAKGVGAMRSPALAEIPELLRAQAEQLAEIKGMLEVVPEILDEAGDLTSPAPDILEE